jgi:hypothetical protein
MTHRPTLSTLLACVCTSVFALALPAHAQDMKPGLWAMSNNFSSKDPQVQNAMSMLQQRMAGMSPEQRAQIEQMMKKNGVQVDAAGDGSLQTKMCLTREMIARREFPVQQGDCKQSFTPAGSNGGHVTLACTKPRITGEGDLTLIGDTAYRANMHIVNEGGPSQAIDVNVMGKWLSADCGALRPAK